MTDRRRPWRIIRRIWISLGLSATAVFVGWSVIAYRATGEARGAATADSLVAIERTDGGWRFEPRAGPVRGSTFVFYPGALVDPRAYAPLLRAVAEAGYRAVLVELPRRGALGGADSPELAARTRSVLAGASSPGGIVVGGHSRGAVVATRVAAGASPQVRGLVLVGTSHPRDQDLSGLTIPITKIVGTRDGLASPGEVRANAALLPGHTRWIWIEGGNHSQFGWYGLQPFDRRPAIEAGVQREIMIRGVLDLLGAAAAPARPGTDAPPGRGGAEALD